MILLLKKIYIYVCLITYFIHPVIIFSVDYISDTIPRSNFNHRIAQKYDDTFESIQCVIVKWERGCNNFHIQRSCMLVKVDYSSGRNYIKQTRSFINSILLTIIVANFFPPALKLIVFRKSVINHIGNSLLSMWLPRDSWNWYKFNNYARGYSLRNS